MLALRPTHIGMLTLTLLLAACGDGKVAKLPESSETSVAVPQTQDEIVNEPPEVAIKKSGGLGLDMTALAMLHGKIKEYVKSGRTKPRFENNGKANLTDVSEKGYASGFTVDEIKGLDNIIDAHPYIKKYIPVDSQLLQTVSYSFPDTDLSKIHNRPVETYYSPWLVTRLSAEEWGQYGSPGQFYILYSDVNQQAYIHLGSYSRH